MCISVGGQASFSGTGIHAARVKHPKLKRMVHTLGYTVDAKVQDLSYLGGVHANASTARALFIAVPAQKGTIGPDNLIDTTGIEKFIRNQGAQLFPAPRSRGLGGMSFGIGAASFEKKVTVSECGKFTVVTAESAHDIHRALKLVPDARRPTVSAPFCALMQQLYGNADWQFVLACFNKEIGDTATFMLWYDPQNDQELYLPGLDEHTGKKLPVPGEVVDLDHILTVYAPGMVGGKEIRYDNADKVVANGFIPTTVRGFDARGLHADNGDFAVKIADLCDEGVLKVRRIMPPGAFVGDDYQEKLLVRNS